MAWHMYDMHGAQVLILLDICNFQLLSTYKHVPSTCTCWLKIHVQCTPEHDNSKISINNLDPLQIPSITNKLHKYI